VADEIVDNLIELIKVSRLVMLYVTVPQTKGELLPGVKQAIEVMKSCGLRLAVASSSSKRLITTVLEHFDLTGSFELYR